MATIPQNTHRQNPGKLIHLSHIDGLVQDCSNSIVSALDLLQSCTKPSICGLNLQDERGWDVSHIHIGYSFILLSCFIRTSNASWQVTEDMTTHCRFCPFIVSNVLFFILSDGFYCCIRRVTTDKYSAFKFKCFISQKIQKIYKHYMCTWYYIFSIGLLTTYMT